MRPDSGSLLTNEGPAAGPHRPEDGRARGAKRDHARPAGTQPPAEGLRTVRNRPARHAPARRATLVGPPAQRVRPPGKQAHANLPDRRRQANSGRSTPPRQRGPVGRILRPSHRSGGPDGLSVNRCSRRTCKASSRPRSSRDRLVPGVEFASSSRAPQGLARNPDPVGWPGAGFRH